jgi:hypothetical protein
MSFPGLPDNKNVPIIGQPYAIDEWYLTAVLTCKCGGQPSSCLVSSIAGMVGVCPACKRGFQLQGVQMSPEGQLEFVVAISEGKPLVPVS